MRVVIVGGYGVFGTLTARLLARDGHKLWLAGRHPEKGRKVAADIGANTLPLDIQKDLEALFDVRPDVVIDASGPFQQYGEDPYKIPRRCIEHGCHYLDLSDSSEFTSGITSLNAQAENAQVFVLSGASSVPGLSSSVVADLMSGLDHVELIDMAILPGNRAPRGVSVIKSIVSQVGRPSHVMRDGRWQTVDGWTDRQDYQLEPGLTRAGYFVDVPDIKLLPDGTGAKSVMFRAGLELPVMNWALSMLAQLRKTWRIELPNVAYSVLHVLSKALYPFGTDLGGMQVNVSGAIGGRSLTRKWTLIAEKGHGPYVPGLMCRAILREFANVQPGARPCLAEVPVGVIEDAMADLRIKTKRVDLIQEHRFRVRNGSGGEIPECAELPLLRQKGK